MKPLRELLFIVSTLVLLMFGVAFSFTAAEFGATTPVAFVDVFYETWSSFTLDYNFFGTYGPVAVVTLILLLSVATYPTYSETIDEIVDAMRGRGYELHVGGHFDITGYWAMFVDSSEADEDRELYLDAKWTEVGHGVTPLAAVQMARDIALGRPVTIPSSSEFSR